MAQTDADAARACCKNVVAFHMLASEGTSTIKASKDGYNVLVGGSLFVSE